MRFRYPITICTRVTSRRRHTRAVLVRLPSVFPVSSEVADTVSVFSASLRPCTYAGPVLSRALRDGLILWLLRASSSRRPISTRYTFVNSSTLRSLSRRTCENHCTPPAFLLFHKAPGRRTPPSWHVIPRYGLTSLRYFVRRKSPALVSSSKNNGCAVWRVARCSVRRLFYSFGPSQIYIIAQSTDVRPRDQKKKPLNTNIIRRGHFGRFQKLVMILNNKM